MVLWRVWFGPPLTTSPQSWCHRVRAAVLVLWPGAAGHERPHCLIFTLTLWPTSVARMDYGVLWNCWLPESCGPALRGQTTINNAFLIKGIVCANFEKLNFLKLKFVIVMVLETMSENINQFGLMVSELWADGRSQFGHRTQKLSVYSWPGRPGLAYISRFIINETEKLQEHDVSRNQIIHHFDLTIFFQGSIIKMLRKGRALSNFFMKWV